MHIDTKFLKSLVKQGFIAILSILFLTLISLIINWVLLVFLIPELRLLFDASSGRGGHAGGSAAVLALLILVIVNWKASLVFIFYFLIFPVLHFLFAKEYAITKAIQFLIAEKKTQLVDYLLEHFFDKVNTNMEWLESLNSSGLVKTINEYLPIYNQKLDGMSFPIKMLIKLFLSKIDFMGIVSNAISEEDTINISRESLIQKISNKVNETIDDKLFSPSSSSIGILYLMNIISFIAIKIIV